MSSQRYSRQPEGIQIGGQFKSRGLKENAELTLAGAGNESGAVPASGMPVLGTAANGYRDWADEDGHLTKQVRLEDGKPSDAPDGTAAVILYKRLGTTEKHYRNGILHDGSGDTPSTFYTQSDGKTVLTRSYRRRNSWILEQDSPDGQPARVDTEPDGKKVTTWMASGMSQDPAPGTPAIITEFPDGSVEHAHAPCGEVSDLDDGTPAVRRWDAAGRLVKEVRHYAAWVTDGDDGTPAIREFWPNGSLKCEIRVWANQVRPGSSGEPSEVHYNEDGTVASTIQDPRSSLSIWPDRKERGSRSKDFPYARTESRARDKGRS